MGDRGSIQVMEHETGVTGGPANPPVLFPVTLFRHWGGAPEAMVELAKAAFRHASTEKRCQGPYARGEARAILALLTMIAVGLDDYSAYLGSSPSDGAGDDHGNYVLHTYKMRWELEKDGETLWRSPA